MLSDNDKGTISKNYAPGHREKTPWRRRQTDHIGAKSSGTNMAKCRQDI